MDGTLRKGLCLFGTSLIRPLAFFVCTLLAMRSLAGDTVCLGAVVALGWGVLSG